MTDLLDLISVVVLLLGLVALVVSIRHYQQIKTEDSKKTPFVLALIALLAICTGIINLVLISELVNLRATIRNSANKIERQVEYVNQRFEQYDTRLRLAAKDYSELR